MKNQTIKNEPQLSAEMEKRFDELTGLDMCCGCKTDHEEYRHFLATALNEQRETDAKIVESMMEDEEHWKPIADAILGDEK
jgi:hypothetical protein